MFEKNPTTKSNGVEMHCALPIVFELDGFLNALRCVIDCPTRMFSATFIEKGSDLNEIISDSIKYIEESGKLIEIKQCNYNSVYNLFVELIYKRISETKTRALDNLDWNLIEYYGLISTADQEDGPWNRLISQEHTTLRFTDDEGREYISFFVEFSDFVVTTSLGVSWNTD